MTAEKLTQLEDALFEILERDKYCAESARVNNAMEAARIFAGFLLRGYEHQLEED